jgi:hypothetical protein
MDHGTPYMTYHRLAVKRPYHYDFIRNHKINNKIQYDNIAISIAIIIAIIIVIDIIRNIN